MAYKRLLTGLFICLLSFLLMSHNANALSFQGTVNGVYSVNNSAVNLTNAELSHYQLRPTLVQGVLDFSIPTNTKSVNSFALGFTAPTPNKFIMNVSYRYCPRNNAALIGWTGFSSNTYYAVLQQNWDVTDTCIVGSVSVFGASSVYTVTLGDLNYNSFTAWDVQAGAYADFNKPSFIVLSDDADYSSVLNAIKNNTDDIKDKLEEIADSADAALDREQSETQDAADDSSSAGSSASTQSEQATSSLLSTITGFFNAIIGVNPSNCKFNSNLPFLPSNGEIDLCSISTPPIVQTLSSLVLVGLFIPFCIHMFNRFVSITESFQR